MKEKDVSYYRPLAVAAGIGSILGSGIIVSLSATITVWQSGLGLSNGQVGIISGVLTFAIAFGSLIGGRAAQAIGLIKTFNWINLLYALGAAVVIFATGFPMLLVGVVIAGFASGVDLPVSLTVVSHGAPNREMSAKLVSSTQIYWQVGIFSSYICAFVVSKIPGALGRRLVFTVLSLVAAIAWLWRTLSPRLKKLHKEANARYMAEGIQDGKSHKISVSKILFGKNNRKFLKFFIAILIFYVAWNLLANTWGQFRTFIFVQDSASQSFATGTALLLNVLGLVTTVVFSLIAGGKYRTKSFFIGSFIMFTAMIVMAIAGDNLWVAVGAFAFFNLGTPLAGEALYKVWTQESFPVDFRSSIQGTINGISRICCALFAFITPALVVPSVIKTTMAAFAGVIAISFFAGLIMIRLQKKYGIDDVNDVEKKEERN